MAPDTRPLVGSVEQMPGGTGLPASYTQYINSTGVAVIGSSAVEPRSLERADAILQELLAGRSDTRTALAARHAYVAVFAFSESADDIPEQRQHGSSSPAPFGRTFDPAGLLLSFMPEDHLACNTQYAEVEYGEARLVYHVARLVQLGAMNNADRERARNLHGQAVTNGRWAGTVAAASEFDYFSVGVQAWFGLVSPQVTEATGVANSSDLDAYDRGLHDLVSLWFDRGPLPSSCAQQLRDVLDANGTEDRVPQWTQAEGTYDTSAPFQVVVNAELPDDDPIAVWCERYDDCSVYGPPEVSACREVLARDRGLARSYDVPDFTLELGGCAEESTCFEYLDCRYTLQYGPYPWTAD